MAYQAVFKRYEIKYMLTEEQKNRILAVMSAYMELDRYGRSTIRNIYYDTDDYILARHSIEKPEFKEKLRVRSYSRAEHDSIVFVELKRKFDHVVYKRRVGMSEEDAAAWTAGRAGAGHACPAAGADGGNGRPAAMAAADPADPAGRQLTDEITYFLNYYRNLRPAACISYDREAYRMKDTPEGASPESGFRVTFDSRILCRDTDLTLCSDVYGTPLLEPGMVLMELKCPGGIPMWMVRALSEEHIYKTSFSKYGTAYTSLILPGLLEKLRTLRTAELPEQQAAREGVREIPNAAARMCPQPA